MWVSEDTSAGGGFERVLPNGCMSLIVNLREDRTRVYDSDGDGTCASFKGSVVAGASSEFVIIDTAELQATAGVAFKAGGAYPFLGLPAGELGETHLSLDTLWGAEAGYLRERLLEADTAEAKFRVLERALLSRRVEPADTHPAVRFAVDNFERQPCRAISAVTSQIGLGERRFVQVFAQQVGLTPKLFCRVQRFQQVLERIADGGPMEWSGVALDCGYYDQPHFIHDFRAFSGINPTTYLANRTQFVNHVTVTA
jgi:methylphosphotriester-DNA--protein-cysteine methyltransferase